VIQKNNENAFVSTSPFEETLKGLDNLHHDISEAELEAAVNYSDLG